MAKRAKTIAKYAAYNAKKATEKATQDSVIKTKLAEQRSIIAELDQPAEKTFGEKLDVAVTLFDSSKELAGVLTEGGERDKRKVTPFITNSYGTIEYKSHIK